MTIATITVNNSDELSAAIRKLSGAEGGVIKVGSSDDVYALSMYRGGTDAGTIRIEAADPGNPPVFSQVKLVESKNMVFSGISVNSVGQPYKGKDLEILKSSDITVENSTFVNKSNGFYTGQDPDIKMGSAMGLIRDSTDVVFTGNDVSQYGQGLALIDTTGTTISDNTFSKMTGDGLRMSGVQDTVIEGNTFSAFYGSTQNVNHSDMIQVWSAAYNTMNTENLTIRGNMFNSSDGVATQTIFIRNETFPDTGTKFRNITIEDNVTYNGHIHGVAISDTVGVNIHNNTMLWNPDAMMQSTPTSTPVTSVPAIRLVDVDGAVITGNITGGISAAGANISNNAIVNFDDPSNAFHVSNHFINADKAGVIEMVDMLLLPDSPWKDKLGASASSMDSGPLTAIIRQMQDTNQAGLSIFDASSSFGPEGALDAEDATYTWTFADGTVLTGQTVARIFETSGLHSVTLSVSTSHGTSEITRTTNVEPDLLFSLDFEDGFKDRSSFDSKVYEVGSSETPEGVDGGKGFHLNGENDLNISRSNGQIHDLPSFTLGLSLQRDAGGEAGTFLYKHRAMQGQITKDGAVSFTVRTSDGSFTAKTEAGLISDTQWHRIEVVFGEGNGGLDIFVDGALAGHANATGLVVGNRNYHLTLGNTWGDSLEGRIDDVSMTQSIVKEGEAASYVAQKYPYATVDTASVGEVEETPYPPMSDTGDLPSDAETPVPEEEAPAPAPAPAPEEEAPAPEPEETASEVTAPKEPEAAEDTALLRLDLNGRPKDSSDWNSKLWVVEAAETPTTKGVTDGAFVLDGQSKIYATRANEHILNLDTFTLSMSLALEEGTKGTFAHIHNALAAQITKDGALRMSISTTEGTFVATTEPGLIADTDWHRLSIVYDGTEGGNGLELYVDGSLEAQADASGKMASTGTYHLVFGNTWNDSLQGAIDDIVLDGVASDASAVSADYAATSDDMDAANAARAASVPEEDSSLLHIDFNDGLTDTSAWASKLRADSVQEGPSEGVSGDGFVLDGQSKFYVDRDNDQIHRLDQFTMSLSLAREEDGNFGTFAHIHKALAAQITEDGALRMTISTTEGTFVAMTEPGLIADTDWHRLSIVYDGTEGGNGLELYVDGGLEAQVDASGKMASTGTYHLVFGNTWHDSLQGTIDDIDLDATSKTADEIVIDYAAMAAALKGGEDMYAASSSVGETEDDILMETLFSSEIVEEQTLSASSDILHDMAEFQPIVDDGFLNA
jgi:parallel beta-helix repeat protein